MRPAAAGRASFEEGGGRGEEGEPNAGRADAGVAGGTSQAGLPRAAGSRDAVYGDDVAGRVGRITVEGAEGACVEVVRVCTSGCVMMMRVRNLYGRPSYI